MIGQQSMLYLGRYDHRDKADLMIDELRIWDHPRSTREIRSNRYVRLPPETPGLNLAFNWDDFDGDDETVQDASGMMPVGYVYACIFYASLVSKTGRQWEYGLCWKGGDRTECLGFC